MVAYTGSLMMFAGKSAPRHWAFCEGQLLPIAQYEDLYAVLGTIYGGDGETTFALPDLRGRVCIHPDASAYQLGDKGGEAQSTLSSANMPPHSHRLHTVAGMAMTDKAEDNFLAHQVRAGQDAIDIYSPGTPSSALHPAALSTEGEGQPFSNLPPYLAINFIICTEGARPE